jgi:hypothetical protein
MSALPGNPELLGDVSDRPMITQHSLDQQSPPTSGESGINVRQENLLASGRLQHLH